MDFTIGKETELQHLVSLPAVWPQMDLRGGPPREPLRDGPPGGREHSTQLRTLQLLHAVCVALVTVYANKLDNLLDKKRLVELHVHTKHYIGTEGGGMDAEPRKAKMIEFNPIRLSNVCLPVGTQFVISNCLVNANKVVFAVFNERVMECHLAAQVISKKTHLEQTQEEVLRYKVIVETEKQRKALQAAAESEFSNSMEEAVHVAEMCPPYGKTCRSPQPPLFPLSYYVISGSKDLWLIERRDSGQLQVSQAVSLSQDGLFGKALGEALRRLVGKCLCSMLKSKAAEFFDPLQRGVACAAGAEKIAHGLRGCMDENWQAEGFTVLKIDLVNAFNLVSRHALLSECSTHFPELLPWVSWCYSRHPVLWHTLGNLTSQSGVQQGDPLGPLLFSLVLNVVVKAIATHPECSDLSYHVWYLDDGVLAGPSLHVRKALSLLIELGPPLGLHVNIKKCEVFSSGCLSHFPMEMNSPANPILRSWEYLLVTLSFVGLSWIGKGLRQVFYLRDWKMLVKSTPKWLSYSSGFVVVTLFDQDVQKCFTSCTGVHPSIAAWKQAQLSLSRGGLGLRSLSHHAPAAFIASRAHLSVQVEAGCNLTPDHSHSRPADVLISNWVLGKTAACDISVTSPLNSNIMSEAGVTAGAAAQATELRKHEAKDVKCSELGWLCIPLVVESYGAWGKEAMESFSSLASRLAITSSRPKSAVLSELYGRLNLNLVRANVRAVMSRYCPLNSF
eukprot:Em0470g2a